MPTWEMARTSTPSAWLQILRGFAEAGPEGLPAIPPMVIPHLSVAIRRPDCLWFGGGQQEPPEGWTSKCFPATTKDWYQVCGGRPGQLPETTLLEAMQESANRGWLQDFIEEAECRGWWIGPCPVDAMEAMKGGIAASPFNPILGRREQFMAKHSDRFPAGFDPDMVNEFWGWYMAQRWDLEASTKAQFLGRSSFGTYRYDQVRAFRTAIQHANAPIPLLPEGYEAAAEGIVYDQGEADLMVELVDRVAVEFVNDEEVTTCAAKLIQWLKGEIGADDCPRVPIRLRRRLQQAAAQAGLL